MNKLFVMNFVWRRTHSLTCFPEKIHNKKLIQANTGGLLFNPRPRFIFDAVFLVFVHLLNKFIKYEWIPNAHLFVYGTAMDTKREWNISRIYFFGWIVKAQKKLFQKYDKWRVFCRSCERVLNNIKMQQKVFVIFNVKWNERKF